VRFERLGALAPKYRASDQGFAVDSEEGTKSGLVAAMRRFLACRIHFGTSRIRSRARRLAMPKRWIGQARYRHRHRSDN
jgi:hypothetical protein